MEGDLEQSSLRRFRSTFVSFENAINYVVVPAATLLAYAQLLKSKFFQLYFIASLEVLNFLYQMKLSLSWVWSNIVLALWIKHDNILQLFVFLVWILIEEVW